MSEREMPDRSRYPVRKLRKDDPEANNEDLSATTTPAQRLEMMWTLVEEGSLFAGQAIDESRLQRHIIHVQRRKC
jgi:hypothetical protein